MLDEAGFSETSIHTAWREQRNEDIAATIVGYIRRLALGSALVPYAERVDRASLDRGQFKARGGFAHIHKIFDGKLEQVLAELADELWRDAG